MQQQITVRKWLAPQSDITRYYLSADGESVGYIEHRRRSRSMRPDLVREEIKVSDERLSRVLERRDPIVMAMVLETADGLRESFYV